MDLQIKIPAYALKYKDWNDHELVFLSFLYWVWRQPDINKSTQICMYVGDVMKILNQYAVKHGHIQALDNVRRVFKVGKLNNYTLSVRMSDDLKMALSSNGQITGAEVSLFDPGAIGIWYYLAGRCTDSEIIVDTEETYRKKQRAVRDWHWRDSTLQ